MLTVTKDLRNTECLKRILVNDVASYGRLNAFCRVRNISEITG